MLQMLEQRSITIIILDEILFVRTPDKNLPVVIPIKYNIVISAALSGVSPFESTRNVLHHTRHTDSIAQEP